MESKFHTRPGIRNPGRGIEDPRLSRIALHDSNLIIVSSVADPGLVYPYHHWGGAAYMRSLTIIIMKTQRLGEIERGVTV